jgi:myotubularin-related protein 3/4
LTKNFVDEQTNLISKEFKRMKFDPKLWRVSDLNVKFELCPTYPEYIIVPKAITDEQLRKVASFRSSKRFPAVVWRSKRNGTVIARSSQPSVGLWARRLNEDEMLLRAIAEASCLNASSSSSSSSSPSSISLTANNPTETSTFGKREK